jgi:chromosome partitioning protein
MKKLTIANQKGGVGKTTVGVHLAFRFVEIGKRVLYIDIDPQGNSSKTLAAYASGIVASQLFDEKPVNLQGKDGITLIAADGAMVDIERADKKVISFFAGHLQNFEKSAFDICIIDTPPTMGLRMTAAMIVTNYVLAPIELEEYSLDGIEKLLKTIIGVKKMYNEDLSFLGMLPNKFNHNSARQKAALTQLLSKFAQYMIPAKIGIRSGIPEALAAGIPVWKLKKTAAREAGNEFKAAIDLIFDRMGVAA